eukprot:13378147-Ditylum_brightwellii.AAC.1
MSMWHQFQVTLGGGQHGHLRLTIGGTKYQTLTGHIFNLPANPGITLPLGDLFEMPMQQSDQICHWGDKARM